MNFASRSAVSARRRQFTSKTKAGVVFNPRVVQLPAKAKSLPSKHRTIGQTVPILPTSSRSAPFWLIRLCYLQRHSSVILFLLVAMMLTVYSLTVYFQQMWSQEYQQLESLQRHERQLTTTNEVLKNQMALQAQQPTMGLVPSNPATAIFLSPAPQRPLPAPESVLPANKPSGQTKQQTPIPLGY